MFCVIAKKPRRCLGKLSRRVNIVFSSIFLETDRLQESVKTKRFVIVIKSNDECRGFDVAGFVDPNSLDAFGEEGKER